MDIQKELHHIGFTPNESNVYLTLLRIGRAGATRIAREAGIERTSTYSTLKRLVKAGLVSFVHEDHKKRFYAGPVEQVQEMFREKEARAELLIPKLKELRKFEQEKESLVKLRGYTGVKTVLNDVLRTCDAGEEYLIFGSENQLQERLPTFAKIFVSRKDKKKLKARILVREGLRTQEKMSAFTSVRYVPDQVMSPAVTNVYGDKVAIILWSEVPEAIIMENKQAADSFRNYFEFMWKNAKKN